MSLFVCRLVLTFWFFYILLFSIIFFLYVKNHSAFKNSRNILILFVNLHKSVFTVRQCEVALPGDTLFHINEPRYFDNICYKNFSPPTWYNTHSYVCLFINNKPVENPKPSPRPREKWSCLFSASFMQIVFHKLLPKNAYNFSCIALLLLRMGPLSRENMKGVTP